MPRYACSAAIGCLRHTKLIRISDSRVHERFQRSCWRRNWRSVVGTAVCETASAAYSTFQWRSTRFVSARSSPNVAGEPKNVWCSHASRCGTIAARR